MKAKGRLIETMRSPNVRLEKCFLVMLFQSGRVAAVMRNPETGRATARARESGFLRAPESHRKIGNMEYAPHTANCAGQNEKRQSQWPFSMESLLSALCERPAVRLMRAKACAEIGLVVTREMRFIF